MIRTALVISLTVALSGCATGGARPSNADFARFVEQQMAKPPFQHAIWGVLVEESDGRVLFEKNAHALLMPASNRKMFASATVANCVRPDSRIVTTILRNGDDIVLRGDGDPTLGAERWAREGEFREVARQLRENGVTTVRDVIGDVSRFDRVTIPASWKVGNLKRPYSAPVDALAWRENDIDDVAPSDPGFTAAEALRDALVAEGIAVTGTVRTSPESVEGGDVIAELHSPYVFSMLGTVLKNSNNQYSEMLFKRLAPEPASYDAAFALERRFLVDEAKLDPEEFSFADGCGLSPEDMMAPASAVRILRWMNEPARAGFWWQLLATPGEEGTLRRRLAGLEERFRGKTGSINGVNALSGIVTGSNGGVRYVSVVVNHHRGESSDAIAIIDAIVQRAAAF